MRILLLIIAALLGLAVDGRTQGPREPVWVPQAPPFGTVASLMGFPDLRSIQPVAGPVMKDIRVSDWSPLRVDPGRLLRLTQVGDTMKATLFLWWYGNVGPYEPLADPSRRCTAPVEGSRVCVQRVALESRDWKPLTRTLLDAPPCEVPRPTDAFELRLQVFDRNYRESELCGPVAEEVGTLLTTLGAPVGNPRK